ncbi:MAG: Glu-tRNA(Gln) amidotransferase subunit GatE [Candidatus Caldarchaeum sp.]|nr:Glu-tRNA(Gln) amidotransferase subunit GatE [Candidatus Caldarchaeum sp.]MDW8434678.1 Glu-tRNA(Gln) amidotransferase subunit GatE [Candidatus Caldarchaeum sp.]
MDYEKIGLKVGVEVHRQLDTRRKLFCDCPTEAEENGKTLKIVRYLREAQSELGTVDPAAVFESKKRKKIIYHVNPANVCLVEMDEEPPHELNPEAIETALTIALLFNSKPVDEIHVMRKIVIDGSNTSGFQRTCIVAFGGGITVDGKFIPIQTITVEEDAARILSTGKGVVEYDLSRLGIPLIEISTAPVIRSPAEATKVAHAIGKILRASRKVKRGLGTVRQDLNVSITGGALTEIKGVQELELISAVVENEVKRQLHLIEIAAELRRRLAGERLPPFSVVDVTEVFRGTRSGLVKKKLEAGGKAYAVKLVKFAGLLSRETAKGIRLGAELAGHAKAWAEVDGILHTDELPGYGVSAEEVEEVKRLVGAGEMDAVVIVVDDEPKALEALRAVYDRACQAVEGVPSETRAARPDGLTVYMRPRPGAARMYPETDIPPVPVGEDLLGRLRENLPETLDQTAERLAKTYGISKQLVEGLIDHEKDELFEQIVKSTKISPSVVAAALTETITNLGREGFPVQNLTDEKISETFRALDVGKFSKEALSDVLGWLCNHPESSVEEAVKNLGLSTVSLKELELEIEEMVKSRTSEIEDTRLPNRLMGELMKKYRGKVDGAVLYSMITERIQKIKKTV